MATKIPNSKKYAKMAKKTPNGHEMHQNFSSQGFPKYTKFSSGNPCFDCVLLSSGKWRMYFGRNACLATQ
jgi:hypothetical protein